MGSPLPGWEPTLHDNYKLFCQDLEEVIQDPNNFVEYHAAGSCSLPLAPQLPVLREYLSRFSEALAFNMDASILAALASPAISSSSTTSRNAHSEQQLATESNPGPVVPPTSSGSAPSTDPGPVDPASFQPGKEAPRPVPVLTESAKHSAQKPGPTHPGDPEPLKTEGEQ